MLAVQMIVVFSLRIYIYFFFCCCSLTTFDIQEEIQSSQILHFLSIFVHLPLCCIHYKSQYGIKAAINGFQFIFFHIF
jgi:hypothetical protein